MSSTKSTAVGVILALGCLARLASCGLKMSKSHDEEQQARLSSALTERFSRGACLTDMDCPGAGTCARGHCEAAPPAEFGMLCGGEATCKSGICLEMSSIHMGFCSQACKPSEAPCPEGSRCVAIGDDGSYCVLAKLLDKEDVAEAPPPPEAKPAEPKAKQHARRKSKPATE